MTAHIKRGCFSFVHSNGLLRQQMETEPLSTDTLASLRGLLDKCTPGPWTLTIETEGSDEPEDGPVVMIPEIDRAFHDHDWADSKDWKRDKANAELIVALRNAAPALLAATSQVAALQQERDEWKALAKVGIWHKHCRPNREMAGRELAKSQAVIDKLADTITELQAQVAALRAQVAAFDPWMTSTRGDL